MMQKGKNEKRVSEGEIGIKKREKWKRKRGKSDSEETERKRV